MAFVHHNEREWGQWIFFVLVDEYLKSIEWVGRQTGACSINMKCDGRCSCSGQQKRGIYQKQLNMD